MSSFDPPLSRSTALILIIAAALACAYVLFVAYHLPATKTVGSTVASGVQP